MLFLVIKYWFSVELENCRHCCFSYFLLIFQTAFIFSKAAFNAVPLLSFHQGIKMLALAICFLFNWLELINLINNCCSFCCLRARHKGKTRIGFHYSFLDCLLNMAFLFLFFSPTCSPFYTWFFLILSSSIYTPILQNLFLYFFFLYIYLKIFRILS